MNKLQKAGIILIFLFFAGMVWMLTMDVCDRVAYADSVAGITVEKVFQAVRKLKPLRNPQSAEYWAKVMHSAAIENDLDPLLVTAIVYRESSFVTVVRSEGGSIGPLQIKANGIAFHRHRPNNCDIRNMRCNIRTGAAFLAWVRGHCGEPWDVWVGGYGMSRCPTPREAGQLRSVRRARRIYESIGGTQWH